MSLNIDNALSDMFERLPNITAVHTKMLDTSENEPRWLVIFNGEFGKLLHVEVIIRDEAIVMSILNQFVFTAREVAKMMDVFTELLNIV
jgi:hypothetical protein